MLSDDLVQEIRDYAIAGDWNVSFDGKSHGNRHLFRMVSIAKFLAEQLAADKNIVEASAWLHDFPLTAGDDYNYVSNKQTAQSVLDDFSLTLEEKNLITECIATHEGTAEPISLEAKIIHDADVLEKTGILGIIRHTWKLIHLSDSLQFSSDLDLAKNVLGHITWRVERLQTILAREIAQYLMDGVDMRLASVGRLVSLIRPLAERNLITEEIAKELRSSLSDQEYRKLDEQLSLDYLSFFQKNP